MWTTTPPLLGAMEGGNAAVITFALYIVGVMVLAWLSGRLMLKKTFISEYFLGSRSLGMWAFALTFAATSSSGGSFTGFPSLVYTHGWIVALWIGSYMIVPIVSMGLLAKRINQVARRTGAITIPDVIRDRFESRTFGTVAILLIVFFMSFNLVAQFKSGGLLLQTLLHDVPMFDYASTHASGIARYVPIFSSAADNPGYLICLMVFAVVVVVYTTYGGFRAVVWTDVMQGFVMVFGVLLMLPLALYETGGLENVTREMAEMTPPQFVTLRLATNSPVSKQVAIPHNTWLVKEEGDLRRVFRLASRAEIPAGGTVAGVPSADDPNVLLPMVDALELTYQKHIEKQIEEQQPDDLPVSLTVNVLTRAALELTADQPPSEEAATAIPIDSVFAVHSEDGESRKFRTLAPAEVLPGETRVTLPQQGLAHFFSEPSAKIPAVELTTGETDEALFDKFGVEASIVPGSESRIRKYKTGADQPGVYITGPGPSAASAAGFLPISLAISFFCMWTFSGAGQPSNMVRLMAFRSSNTLRRAVFTVSIYYSLIYFPLVVIFCCMRVLMPGWENESDRVMPEAASLLTMGINMPWLAGLLVAAPFAAVMSTMDSFLLMISSALVRDVYQRNINPEAGEKTIKKFTYIVTVAVGFGAMLAAVNPPRFLQDIIVFTGSGLSTSFLAPMFLLLYWPRFNKFGAMCAMLGGFATHIGLYLTGFILYGRMTAFEPAGFHPFLVGAATSLLIGIVVALLTPPPPEELVRKFFHEPTPSSGK
jgi:Na+/pantothenate symporter